MGFYLTLKWHCEYWTKKSALYNSEIYVKHIAIQLSIYYSTSETRFFIAVPEFVSRYLFLNFAKFE